MWYYQYVENRRPDLLGLFPLITADPEFANIGRLLDQALAANRPVYLIKPMPGLEIKADLIPLPPLPHAQLVQVFQRSSTPTYQTNLEYGDGLTITGYDLVQTDETLSVTLYWQVGSTTPAEDYTTYIHLVDANGTGLAQNDHRPGGEFYPTSLWAPAETLHDSHTLTLPADLPAGEYALVVGLYFRPKPGVIENLGSGQTLTRVVIE
jgi:hypothetical protein